MPASLLTEILFRGAFEVVFYGLGYLVGWLVVPVFTLGHYRVESWDFKRRRKSRTHSRRPRQVSADAACGIGLATLALAALIAYVAWHAAGA